MGKIKQIIISGFWENKSIQLELNPDINFLIGPNGTGKTTIISIITSALRIDIPSLVHLPFSGVSIVFDDLSHINITKDFERRDSNTVFGDPVFNYRIKIREQEEASFEITPYEYTHLSRLSASRFAPRRPSIHAIKKCIDELVNLSWVSVNRTSILSDDLDNDNSSTDKVLNKLSADLTGYFSYLQNLSNIETGKFQKFIFTSLLDELEEDSLFPNISDTELASTQRKLTSIYETFRIPDSDVKISSYFNGLSRSIDSVNRRNLEAADISRFISYMRIKSIVSEWRTVTNKQKNIFAKKDLFLELINNLFQHKQLFVAASNELRVKGEGGKEFDISFLSSGERQLLIILGQALLQEKGENYIYIADEPELSLHIEWQEKLVQSIRQISSNSQIVFATHSPDIVGPYQDKTIRIDNIVYGR